MEDVLNEILNANAFLTPYLKQFVNHLKKNPRVLDVNCKNGACTRKLKNLSCEVVGIDKNEEWIEKAKEQNPSIPFFVESILNDLSYLALFDGILISFTFCNIKKEEREKTFKNLYDLLKKGGYLLIINKVDEESISVHEYLELDWKSKFCLVEEFIGDNKWNFLLYKKIEENKD